MVVAEYVLWLVAPGLQALLAGIAFRRKLHREYPMFVVYTLSHVVRAAVLGGVHHQYSRQAYLYTFVVAEVLDAALAFAVICELYGHLLRGYEGVQKLAGLVFRSAAAVLLATAVVIAAASKGADADPVRWGLFAFDQAASTVRGGLLLLLFLFASYFGLKWKHCAFWIAAGLALETSVALATYALRVQLGLLGKPILSLITSAAYNCSVFVWLAYLLSHEPATRPAKVPARLELEGWNQTLVELLHQ